MEEECQEMDYVFNCFRHLGVLFFDDKGCVPRRKGTCLFFCGNDRDDYGNHGKRDQYQYQEQQQQYPNSRDPYGKNKKDEPKREKKVNA